MEYSKTRIWGLANCTVKPETGLEKHFVKVCQGEASPITDIEREWWQIVKESMKNQGERTPVEVTVPKTRDEHRHDQAESTDSIVRAHPEKQQYELTELKRKCEELQSELYASREKTGYLLEERQLLQVSLSEQQRESRIQYENSARIAAAKEKKLNSELCETQKNLGELHEKLSAAERDLRVFRHSISTEIQRLLPQVTRDIQEENNRVIEYNKRFSEQNQLLANELRAHIPVRVKCDVCDGVGKWVDKGTFRGGADYDGPNATEVCSNCRGAGFLANPKREELGILPLKSTQLP